MRKYGSFTIIVLLIVLTDQATKYCVDTSMALHQSVPVLEGFFSLTYVRNPGAAFGFLADTSPIFRYFFFIIVNLVAMGLILAYIRKAPAEESGMIKALSLIMAGAAGNLIDRIRFGEVIDFLDVYIGSFHWPAFNVADSAISIGACLLIIQLFKKDKASRKT